MILLALVAVMTSCVKTKQYSLSDEVKGWFVDSDKREFTFRDENGLERRFHVQEPNVQIMDESSSFLLVTTDKAERESIFQYGYPDYSLSFYVGITAGWGNEANVDDSFVIGLGDATFTLSLNGKTFTPVSCSDSNNAGSPQIDFSSELLDSFEVDGVSYADVLHIELIDCDLMSSRFYPTELYYAKYYGLIQYTLNHDIEYYRLAAE